MAERRMFAKTIVLSDAFLDMGLSTRCLYFTLGMLADDDGFVNSPKSIMRQCGASEDDLKVLLAKKFILDCEDGVIVIKHWRINNYLRNDRHIATKYTEKLEELEVDEHGAYTFGIPNSGIPRLGKDRLGKDRLGKDNIIDADEPPTAKRKTFTPPTVDEVRAYCQERNNQVDAELFVDFYTTKDWKVGTTKMKDWKSAVRTWEKRTPNKQPTNTEDRQKREMERWQNA